MDDDQQFCLRWNNHQSTLISVFDTLLENGTLVDCTLAAEGKFLKAHKVVLSACSPYFASLLSQQYDKHPIFILKDVKFQELRAMMDYMYRGEVNISQDQLAALLKAAESLQIKGLSDSRGNAGGSGSGQKQPTNEHKQLSVPAAAAGKSGATSGYTLEQKRPRHTMGPSSIDSQELSGSREGSSSPTSRKRKKVRRRSLDNTIADNHEHSNSSSHSMQVNSSIPPSNTSAAIASVSTAATSSSTPTTVAAISGGIAAGLNVTKKTESVSNAKLESVEHDMDNDNDDDDDDEHDDDKSIAQVRKEQNHKRKTQQTAADSDNGKDNSEMLIEPKSEYDEGNDETVEDLTLDDEELLDDLEQAGPSHGGGEGSSQGYAQWQVDRSQDDVFMATQEAAGQQRDPQVKHDKSEQTDITPEEFELDDCLLESNDIVITQNKDGFVLHVKKLGNITTAKIPDDHTTIQTATATHIMEEREGKPQLTALTTCHPIKLPSSECELIQLKKENLASTSAIATTATIIQPTDSTQAINNILTLQQKGIGPRIKYSRAKFPSPIPHQSNSNTGTTVTTLHMEKAPSPVDKKFEISEIDLNQQASASIISDLVKYAEIDDIELPDGTKIGIGFAPAEISEHIQSSQATQVTEQTDSPSQSPGRSGQEATITKSYTILTTSPMKPQQTTYELSLSDSSMTQSDDNEKLYVCRHCGKKYRWKSTLRRHENVECGGKEPCHPCPYCSYKAKQRGNLGVHVRKHHPDKPQLESKRGRRTM